MADKVNPIEVQKHLGGIDYPANREDLVAKAEKAGADDSIVEALRNLPDREYNGPNAVSEHLNDGK